MYCSSSSILLPSVPVEQSTTPFENSTSSSPLQLNGQTTKIYVSFKHISLSASLPLVRSPLKLRTDIQKDKTVWCRFIKANLSALAPVAFQASLQTSSKNTVVHFKAALLYIMDSFCFLLFTCFYVIGLNHRPALHLHLAITKQISILPQRRSLLKIFPMM